jgi:putative ABC transport system substrate-binding protein
VELRDLHGDRQQALDASRQVDADLVVAVGSLAATVAREQVKDRPVIFCAVLNPERYNLTGPNIGGVSFEVSAAAQLERLRSALPGATRIGVIYDPQKSGALVAEAERAAQRLGLQIVKAVAKQPRDVDPVFRSLKRDIDVLWVIPDSTVVTRESFEVLALGAAESRIPFVAFSEAFARQGALLAFYPDPTAVGDQCATLAGAVLRGEIKPSQVGTRAPERYRIAVNRRVEDQLGLNLDARLHPDVEIR